MARSPGGGRRRRPAGRMGGLGLLLVLLALSSTTTPVQGALRWSVLSAGTPQAALEVGRLVLIIVEIARSAVVALPLSLLSSSRPQAKT